MTSETVTPIVVPDGTDDEAVASLPLSAYSARIRHMIHGPVALEVRAGDRVVDMATTWPQSMPLLRGAVRGDGWALAWGQLPPGESTVVVVFTPEDHPPTRAVVMTFAEGFWIAEGGGGQFRSVSVATRTDRATAALRTSRPEW